MSDNNKHNNELNPYDVVKQEMLPINFRPATDDERQKITDININMFIKHEHEFIKKKIEQGRVGVKEKTPQEIEDTKIMLKSKWDSAQFLIHEAIPDKHWVILILTRLECHVRTGDKFIKYHSTIVDSCPDFSKYEEFSF